MPGAVDDLVSTIKGGVTNLAQIHRDLQTLFPRTIGTFTLSNATTTVVTQPNVAANSFVGITPTNTSAALLQRTAGVYLSALTAGASFSISTQNGSAAGTETFSYIVVSPV